MAILFRAPFRRAGSIDAWLAEWLAYQDDRGSARD